MRSRSGCLALIVSSLLIVVPQIARAGDAPEISRSAGIPNGVVLLWPRIIPSTEVPNSRELAAQVQRQVEAFVHRALPGWPVDVRPEPERVCRMAGCEGVSIGALLVRKQQGCVIVALVSGPGTVPAQLVPWVGEVTLKNKTAPFRQPPESQLTITDYAACAEVVNAMPQKEEAALTALRNTATATAAALTAAPASP